MSARQWFVCAALVALGCAQMLADVAGWPRVKAVAAATQVSPAMKVFTAHQGYETHAAQFEVHWQARDGRRGTLALTPATYRGLRGPYNRRNVYGAALAYAPVLRADPRTRPLQESVLRHSFCAPGTLRAELGLPGDATHFRMVITPRRHDARRDLEREFTVHCA